MTTLHRRTFLGASTAVAAGLIARGADANSKLSVGIVGLGRRGSALMRTFFDVNAECNAELTAVCDLWSLRREQAAALVKEKTGNVPRIFKYLEELLNWKGLDAVIVATPDHAHARLLVQSLRAGKHVYCEKPMANVLDEANEVLDVWSRSTGKAVTVGTQRRSHPQILKAADVVGSGLLGPISRVDISEHYRLPYQWRRPADVKLLREADTDWKAWLRGRPARKFDPHVYLEFRLYRDFSSGIIDQWYSHMSDTCHMLTGATFPRSIVANGGIYSWKDGRDSADAVTIVADYAEGFLFTYSASHASGLGNLCAVSGSKGAVEFEHSWKVRLVNNTRGTRTDDKPLAPKQGLRGTMEQIHLRNWLECAAAAKKNTTCTPEHGYQGSIACLMAARALASGRRQLFDKTARVIRDA